MSKNSVAGVSADLNQLIIKGMLEKKAVDIVLIDLRGIKKAVADYFIICSGNSDTQLDSISESIEHEVRKATNQLPWQKEGRENKEWILLDYVNVVVHVFKKDVRSHFGLEELWGDAKITHVTDAEDTGILS